MISNPDRARIYQVFSDHMRDAASPSGHVLFDALRSRCAKVTEWAQQEDLDDRRASWLLNDLDWKDGLFRNQTQATVDVILEVASRILSYDGVDKVWLRPGGRNILVAGQGAGQLVVLETKADLARGGITPDTILVAPEVWRAPYPVVAGIILTRPTEIEGAHHLGWFSGIRSPMVCMPGEADRLRTLATKGTWCKLEATGPEVHLLEGISSYSAADLERQKRPPLRLQVSNPPLQLVTTENALAADIGSVGHKFAGLHNIDSAPPRVAIPSSYETLFLTRVGAANEDAPAITEKLETLTFEQVRADVETLFHALLEALPVKGKRVRLRTSSNYEDLLGAGVAESKVIDCRTPLDLFEGMRCVYAGQFSERACLVRRIFGVSAEERRMAIFVHESIEDNRWNGTAMVSRAGGGELRLRILAMKGSKRLVTARGSSDALDLDVSGNTQAGQFIADKGSSLGWLARRAARRIGTDLARAMIRTRQIPAELEWVARLPVLGKKETHVLQVRSNALRPGAEMGRSTEVVASLEEFLAKSTVVTNLSRWLERAIAAPNRSTKFAVFESQTKHHLALASFQDADHAYIQQATLDALPDVRVIAFGRIWTDPGVDAQGVYVRRIGFGEFDAVSPKGAPASSKHTKKIELALTLALQESGAASCFRGWTESRIPEGQSSPPIQWFPKLPV